PPALEPTTRRLRVYLPDGVTLVASTQRAQRILETSHPPTYYIPQADVDMRLVRPASDPRPSFCEWKGVAAYFDVFAAPPDAAGGSSPVAKRRVWSYPTPNARYAAIANHLSFYADPFICYVDDERVVPQPGDFYGGWLTSDIDASSSPSRPRFGGKRGVKGGPGTWEK
ncbi:hypothetical protein DFJ73DRAFT_781742, partial [Zopfochytrium polystomum]